MRSLIAFSAVSFVAFGLFVAAPAHSDILYARPDGDSISRAYRWGNETVLDPIPFKSAMGIAKAANGSRALEIRLLHQVDAQETVISSTSAASNLPCGGEGPRTSDFSSADRSKRLRQARDRSRGLLDGP